MLIALSNFIRRASPSSISTVRLSNYLFTLLAGADAVVATQLKFVTDPLPSTGIDHINGMLIRADIPGLVRYENDMERFGKITKMLASASFSRYLMSNVTLSNAFIRTYSIRPVEFVIPVRDIGIFSTIPWESSDVSQWMSLRPFRMLSCPSQELSGDNLTSKLKFSEYPPLEATFALDIALLLLVYTKICILSGIDHVESTNRYPFIYDACIQPLLFDSHRAWLLELFTVMTLSVSLDSGAFIDSDSVHIGNRAIYAQPNFESVMGDVRKLLVSCRDGRVGADVVLRSLSIQYGYDIIDEISFIRDGNFVDGGIDMYWLTFIKEFSMLKFVIMVYSLDSSSPRYLALAKIVRASIRKLKQQKFWNATPNPAIKAIVQSKFEEISSFVEI